MTKTKLFLALALVAMVGTAEASRTYTKQNTKQETKLIGGEQTTVFIDAAQAPGGVIGKCLAAYGAAVANNGWSISFGANRRLRSCEIRELAGMLFRMGQQTKDADMVRMAKLLLFQQFNDIQRKREVRYTCKRPVADHCTTGARVDGER